VKVTLPDGNTVGVPPAGDGTVAVKVTLWFTEAGLGDDVDPTVGEALVTVSVKLALGTGVKLVSPA